MTEDQVKTLTSLPYCDLPRHTALSFTTYGLQHFPFVCFQARDVGFLLKWPPFAGPISYAVEFPVGVDMPSASR